jgi:DNA-binding MarR family transcriptional regulator
MSSATEPDLIAPVAYLDRPALLLARVGRITERRFADELEGSGLKPAQVGILISLRGLGRVGQQARGELLQIDPSNLVTLLNSLEHDGLITRRRDPTDRRRHIVEISEPGLARLAQAERPLARVEDALLARLDHEEREQLRVLLGRILAAASPVVVEEAAVVLDLN